jgi:hypothetical protein
MWPKSDAEWLAIGQALTLLTAFLAWLQSRRNAQHQKINSEKSQAAIQRIELSINGKLAALLDSEKAQSLAQGRVEGIASERADPQISNPQK